MCDEFRMPVPEDVPNITKDITKAAKVFVFVSTLFIGLLLMFILLGLFTHEPENTGWYGVVLIPMLGLATVPFLAILRNELIPLISVRSSRPCVLMNCYPCLCVPVFCSARP